MKGIHAKHCFQWEMIRQTDSEVGERERESLCVCGRPRAIESTATERPGRMFGRWLRRD